jgi:hypothetical protein
MRLPAVLPIALLVTSPARATIEAENDLSVGSDYVYLHSAVRGEVWREHLALGAGLLLIGDLRTTRLGGEATAVLLGGDLDGGLTVGWAPEQAGRGWLRLEPHGSVHLSRGRFSPTIEGGLLLRRIEGVGRRSASEQLQIDLSGTLEIDHRWRLGASGLCSFYEPDLVHMDRGDLGLFISVAGHPERGAAGVELERVFAARLWMGLQLVGVAYADVVGGALVPAFKLGLGPFAGLTLGLEASVALGVAGPGAEPPRPMGGLSVSYER